MSLARREFLRLAGLAAAGVGAAACSPLYRRLAGSPAIAAWPEPGGAFQALSRLTFGPRPEERARVAEIGLEAWIEEQLAPERLDDRGADLRVRLLDALELDADALANWEREEVVAQLRQGTLLRQIYSRRQLYERIVAFWTDHFNISVAKGDCWFLKVVDDREVVRAHALGNFRDLLQASAHSPAMLVYLDNQVNEWRAPNENYAREVMELHTLGVDGGYTQQDVMELARALTGWTVKENFWRGEFTFNPDLHDPGVKHILGMRIEPAGQREAEAVLDHLALHPSTARHLARKLVRRFISDRPEEEPQLVQAVADTFLRTRGDLRAVFRTLLLDGLARRPGPLPPKFKRPHDYVVSALRQSGADTTAGRELHRLLDRMGQPLFGWPTPDGPPDVADPWLGALLPRWQFALALARQELEGTSLDLAAMARAAGGETLEAFLERASVLLLGDRLPEAEAGRLAGALRREGVGDEAQGFGVLLAGLVASPPFQWM